MKYMCIEDANMTVLEWKGFVKKFGYSNIAPYNLFEFSFLFMF